MARIDVSISDELTALLDQAVAEGVFQGTSDVARIALRQYFANNPEVRFEAVATLYTDDEITFMKAVRLSGIEPEKLETRLEEWNP